MYRVIAMYPEDHYGECITSTHGNYIAALAAALMLFAERDIVSVAIYRNGMMIKRLAL